MMFDGLLPNVLAMFPVEWFSKIRRHISCWVSDNMGNFWAMIFFLFWEWVYHSEICCLMSGMFFLSINPSIRPFISSEDSFLFSPVPTSWLVRICLSPKARILHIGCNKLFIGMAEFIYELDKPVA